MPFLRTLALPCLAALFVCPEAMGDEPPPDLTCFQSGEGYMPEIDIGSDMAIVYGTGPDFADRVASWRDRGYTVGMMTGIAWGGYHDYFGEGDAFKRDEVQTMKDGSLRMHGGGVGYNVPTRPYIEYIKKRVEPAIEAGVVGIFLEEPEYWTNTGWSPAFQKEWQDFYGEPWQAPDSSVDAQYRASKLKRELYFKALQEVFAHADKLAADRGHSIQCVVPTHSLINYAHWGIVSPESYLVDIPEMDGYIAQVWTGTSRTPNRYAGVKKERTFETAFLEYGQMLNMVRPTERRVWFLADPIEDNPNYSWNNYKMNYECTIVASLMWPEVHHYEVMPWPSRIFKGAYPKVDMDTQSGDREGIPAAYATQLLTVINALNEMNQDDVEYDVGTRGIGVVVSDTLMFQRAAPSPSHGDMDFFYGLALPLLKAGVPVEPVQLENSLQPGALDPYRVLLLSYEGQKPLKPEYHDALAAWVQNGGALIFVDDERDPYNAVREWWNDQGQSDRTPADDLLERLGVSDAARQAPESVGQGFVRVIPESPTVFAASAKSADELRARVREMLEALGRPFETQNYLRIRRGPFVVASVLDESVTDEPLRLQGAFVDLFNPELPLVSEKVLQPNERTLLYDLDWARKQPVEAKVLAAGSRIRGERVEDGRFRFTARGPSATTANARVLLPREPQSVAVEPEAPLEQRWDAESSTLWLSFPNRAEDMAFEIRY